MIVSDSIGIHPVFTDLFGGPNLSVPGRTADVAFTETGIADIVQAITPDVRLLVLALAYNDYGQQVPLDVFTARYDAVLTAVRAAHPDLEILVLGPWPTERDTENTVEATKLIKRNDYAAVQKALAAVHGAHFLKVHDIYMSPAHYTDNIYGYDWIHPVECNGHFRIAALVSIRLASMNIRLPLGPLTPPAPKQDDTPCEPCDDCPPCDDCQPGIC